MHNWYQGDARSRRLVDQTTSRLRYHPATRSAQDRRQCQTPGIRMQSLWYNLSAGSFRAKLAEKEFKVGKQHISNSLRNPFYCDLMAHNISEGNHERLIPQEVFLKVNDLLKENQRGHTVKGRRQYPRLSDFWFAIIAENLSPWLYCPEKTLTLLQRLQ